MNVILKTYKNHILITNVGRFRGQLQTAEHHIVLVWGTPWKWDKLQDASGLQDASHPRCMYRIIYLQSIYDIQLVIWVAIPRKVEEHVGDMAHLSGSSRRRAEPAAYATITSHLEWPAKTGNTKSPNKWPGIQGETRLLNPLIRSLC